MKVCTDACAFGAWADVLKAKRILDIGTGTGLLAMMAAQRNENAFIEAVEINPEAADQARTNVRDSPFCDRINVFQTAVQDFNPKYQYDAILVNPPFYQNDLRSPDAGINQAHHAQSLSIPELLVAVARLLKPSGSWHILLPVEENESWSERVLSEGWMKQKELFLYHSMGYNPFRVLGTFSKKESGQGLLIPEKLFIYEPGNLNHTLAFRQLLKEFYLKF